MKYTYKTVEKALKISTYYEQKSERILNSLNKNHNSIEIFIGALKASGAHVVCINNYAELEKILPVQRTNKNNANFNLRISSNTKVEECVHVKFALSDCAALWVDKETMISLELSGNLENKKFVLNTRMISDRNLLQAQHSEQNGYYLTGPKIVFPHLQNIVRNLNTLTVYLLSIDDYPLILSNTNICPVCLDNLN